MAGREGVLEEAGRAYCLREQRPPRQVGPGALGGDAPLRREPQGDGVVLHVDGGGVDSWRPGEHALHVDLERLPAADGLRREEVGVVGGGAGEYWIDELHGEAGTCSRRRSGCPVPAPRRTRFDHSATQVTFVPDSPRRSPPAVRRGAGAGRCSSPDRTGSRGRTPLQSPKALRGAAPGFTSVGQSCGPASFFRLAQSASSWACSVGGSPWMAVTVMSRCSHHIQARAGRPEHSSHDDQRRSAANFVTRASLAKRP